MDIQFKNKILKYPEIIKDKIAILFKEGYTSKEIREYLIKYFNTELAGKIPSKDTIKTYTEHTFKTVPMIEEKTGVDMNIVPPPAPAVVDLEILRNKKDILEDLVSKCYTSLADITNRQMTRGMDARWASIWRGLVEEIRHLVETLAKLSGELESDNVVMVSLVQSELMGLIQIVQDIIQEICPEKIDVFKNMLKDKLSLKFGTIETSIVNNDINKDEVKLNTPQ